MCNVDEQVVKYERIVTSTDRTYVGSYFQSRGVSSVVFDTYQLGSSMPSSDLYGPYEHKPLMPINDVNGNLVSLALRLGDSGHKYHYLPFSKMHHLFGLDKAQEYIIKEDMVYIVEGFFDVLLPVSNGVRNVVAIMGTRISKEQVYLLASFTNNFTFVLDSDGAGMRSIPLVTKLIQELAPDVTCHTMFTYPYKDFADYCTGGGLCRNQNLTKNQNL